MATPNRAAFLFLGDWRMDKPIRDARGILIGLGLLVVAIVGVICYANWEIGKFYEELREHARRHPPPTSPSP